jgi:biotin carboxyl carrier protein
VGLYGFAPRVGEVLVAGSRAGRIISLGRTMELVVPKGVTGRVAERQLATRSDPVEYGQVLLRLVPVEASDVGEGIVSGAEKAARGLPEGTHAVTSPSHGMFYRRPRPDEPAYVEVGQVVDTGSTLGLVEVMKCFSAISYGGDQLPARAEIVEVRAEDGSEVAADQILFVVRPA